MQVLSMNCSLAMTSKEKLRPFKIPQKICYVVFQLEDRAPFLHLGLSMLYLYLGRGKGVLGTYHVLRHHSGGRQWGEGATNFLLVYEKSPHCY